MDEVERFLEKRLAVFSDGSDIRNKGKRSIKVMPRFMLFFLE